MNIESIIVLSGGMDSAICLAKEVNELGADKVLAISFKYGQRHSIELDRASQLVKHFKVKHKIIEIGCLEKITSNALLNHGQDITHNEGETPNTLVVGRNGLMARVAAIHAFELGAKSIVMGIIGVEAANSGYRDCTRNYMDKLEVILNLDFDTEDFKIKSPLVDLTKMETMELADQLGELVYLLETTITCYEGIDKEGCLKCPACILRNEGIIDFYKNNPDRPRPSYFQKIQ